MDHGIKERVNESDVALESAIDPLPGHLLHGDEVVCRACLEQAAAIIRLYLLIEYRDRTDIGCRLRRWRLRLLAPNSALGRRLLAEWTGSRISGQLLSRGRPLQNGSRISS